MMAERPPQGVDKYLDREVVTSDGARLGVVARILRNRVNEIPEWIVVEGGLFGRKRTVVPLAGSSLEDDHVTVSYTNAVITAQPHSEPEDDIDALPPDAEDALNAHFGLGFNEPETSNRTRQP